jgi:hypothetical protein
LPAISSFAWLYLTQPEQQLLFFTQNFIYHNNANAKTNP